MKLRRYFVLQALFLVSCVPVGWAQSPLQPDSPEQHKIIDPKANPAFAVASIKLSPPGPRGKGIRIVGRQLSGTNQTVNDLIRYSYGVHASQISGGPLWLASKNFDVLAEPDGEGQPSDQQWRVMVQKLLVDRFRLAFHRDKKEMPVYTLAVAKGGPKLMQSSASDPSSVPSFSFRLGSLIARNAGIGDLAFMLQDAVMDRPVLDETGVAGKFDFTLNWTPDEFQFAARGLRSPPLADGDKAPPDLYAAIREELGLKLESTKAPADVLVIDHVEEPSEN